MNAISEGSIDMVSVDGLEDKIDLLGDQIFVDLDVLD
jgi:hypothetical protein